ncbi:nudC domain-containing protein 3 [Clupea harengus]|uniref:NudC domain-containing protein 3 n=1 Tax=Clupea harengus TaxID=7950 RepID=A0A6P3VG78_CLUHA|nr:nudC domain-containing protein 3 [Clupea harengus]
MSSPIEMTEMYDNALLGILQHVGNIQDFLQVYFGFLYRKTDFYRLLSNPNDRMGFPPGVAEKMILRTFKTFEKFAIADREREMQRRAPAVIQELEVPSEQEEAGAVAAAAASCSAEETAPSPSPASSSSSAPAPVHLSPGPSSASAQAAGASSQSQSSSVAQPSGGDQAVGSSGAGATAAEPGKSDFQSNPDSYNGAVTENYTWSQDYTDVEIKVHVQPNILKGKQVSVNFQSDRLRVALKEGASERVVVEGALCHKINMETSLWSLEPGQCILISLSKCGEVWWNAVLKGEKEIDINQINRERSMATVDEEEHAVLDRLTFDYHQKLQGKPQSHEMKVHDMLKKGWDAEGSPFKGQQFDPSMFDIPPSAVQF